MNGCRRRDSLQVPEDPVLARGARRPAGGIDHRRIVAEPAVTRTMSEEHGRC